MDNPAGQSPLFTADEVVLCLLESEHDAKLLVCRVMQEKLLRGPLNEYADAIRRRLDRLAVGK